METLIKAVFWSSCFLILYTYLLYPLILFVTRKRPAKRIRGSASFPSVTLIVSAFNEEKCILDKLKNTARIDYPENKLEVIIASDGSTDRTDEIIDGYHGPRIKHIRFGKRSGKIGVLNRVIPRAAGEIVILSDANTIYHRDAIKHLVRNFGDTGTGCVCGRLVLKNPEDSRGGELEGVYWSYETRIKMMEGSRGALLGANGGIYAFRKHLFKPLPQDTIVEDFIIPMNILIGGHKVVFEPHAVAYEETSKDLANEQIRKVRIGAGDYQALLMTLPMLNIFRGFPSFAYWSHKVIRWAVPFLIVAILVSNFLMLNERLYYFAHMFQGVFYGGVCLGLIFSKRAGKFKIFGFLNFLYYFFSMNICLLLGFVKFAFGMQKITWQKVER